VPSTAARKAVRTLPGPASSQFVTTIVLATADGDLPEAAAVVAATIEGAAGPASSPARTSASGARAS